jgi:hypothetical protein
MDKARRLLNNKGCLPPYQLDLRLIQNPCFSTTNMSDYEGVQKKQKYANVKSKYRQIPQHK